MGVLYDLARELREAKKKAALEQPKPDKLESSQDIAGSGVLNSASEEP